MKKLLTILTLTALVAVSAVAQNTYGNKLYEFETVGASTTNFPTVDAFTLSAVPGGNSWLGVLCDVTARQTNVTVVTTTFITSMVDGTTGPWTTNYAVAVTTGTGAGASGTNTITLQYTNIGPYRYIAPIKSVVTGTNAHIKIYLGQHYP